MLAVVLANFVIFAPQKVEGQKQTDDKECRVKIIDCEGWFTGERQVCVRGGTGVLCKCGDMSDCYGGWF